MSIQVTGGVTFTGGSTLVESFATIPLSEYLGADRSYNDMAYETTNGFVTTQTNTGNDSINLDGISIDTFNAFKNILGDPGTGAHGGYFFAKWDSGSTTTPGGVMSYAPSYTALAFIVLYYNAPDNYGLYIAPSNPFSGDTIAGTWLFPARFTLFQQTF